MDTIRDIAETTDTVIAPVPSLPFSIPTAKPRDVSITPEWVWKGTVPCLNGLRAIAILCVIASHYNRDFNGSWVIGHFGVTSFFVLSGFLITLLLIRERQRTGDVSLKGFYQRRALRIFPAYFTFLLAMAGLTALRVISPSLLAWVTAITYTSCFVTLRIDPHLAHSWSLSVEEHFYLLWPLLFRRTRSRTAIGILLLLALISLPLRYLLLMRHSTFLDVDYASPAQMGSLAIGCLIAFFVTGQFLPRFRASLARWPLMVLLGGSGILLGSVVALRSHPMVHHALMDPVRSVAFGLIMLGVLYSGRENSAYRFLNTALLNWIGILSYSLYLWQQVFILEGHHMPGGMPVALGLLGITACLSYFLIEAPFLRLKQRISTHS